MFEEDDAFEPVAFKEVVFTKLPVFIQRWVKNEDILDEAPFVRNHLKIELGPRMEEDLRGCLLKMRSYVLANHKEEIKVEEKWPEDWWEAVKERFAPKWFLRKYPVKYKEISIHRTFYQKTCPHLNVVEERDHINFLVMDGDNGQKENRHTG